MTDPDMTIIALFALGIASYIGWLVVWIIVQYAKAGSEADSDKPHSQESPK